MNRSHGRLAATLLLLLLSCSEGGREQAPAKAGPISYDGATSVSRHVLDQAVPAFTAKTGIPFGAVFQSGGGKGLERLFAGEVDLAGVARRLTPQELQRHPRFQIIGYDALGIYVNGRNPVKGLTKAQLKAIFSGTIVNWKDVGGPNLPIVGCTEPLSSGRNTLAVFQTTVLDEAPFASVKELADPADCLAFVATTAGAITFATIAYAVPGARTVTLDGIEPTPAHVTDSSYLLSRPLLLVTRQQPPANVAAFLEFMLSAEGQAIVGRKFIPAR